MTMSPSGLKRLYVSANDYAEEALNLMLKRGQGCVEVLDGDKKVGFIYRKDLLSCSRQYLKSSDVRAFIAMNDGATTYLGSA